MLEDVRDYGLKVKTAVIITSDSDQSEAVRALLRAEPVINVVVVHNSRTNRELMTSRHRNLTTIRWDKLKSRRRGPAPETAAAVTRTVTPSRFRAASPLVRMGLAEAPTDATLDARPAAARAAVSPSAGGRTPAAAVSAIDKRIAANIRASPAPPSAVPGGGVARALPAATIVPPAETTAGTVSRGRTPRAVVDHDTAVAALASTLQLTRISSGAEEGDEPIMDASTLPTAEPRAPARARSAMRGANGSHGRRSTSVTFAPGTTGTMGATASASPDAAS